MLPSFQRPSRQSSSIAAAMLILVEAATGIAFVLLLVSPRPDRMFLIIAGVLLVLALLVAWLYRRPSSLLAETMSWVMSRKARPERTDYDLSRKPVSFRRFGTRTPPSVDQIRDLKSGSTSSWVPSQQVAKPSKQR
jgi:hypothetical protein